MDISLPILVVILALSLVAPSAMAGEFSVDLSVVTSATDFADPDPSGVSGTISPTALVGAANRASMLWVDGSAIYSLVGASVQRFAPSVDNAQNLAVGGGKVYWTEATGASGGTVNSTNLNGSGVTELVSILATPMGSLLAPPEVNSTGRTLVVESRVKISTVPASRMLLTVCGIYFYQFETDTMSSMPKMVILK